MLRCWLTAMNGQVCSLESTARLIVRYSPSKAVTSIMNIDCTRQPSVSPVRSQVTDARRRSGQSDLVSETAVQRKGALVNNTQNVVKQASNRSCCVRPSQQEVMSSSSGAQAACTFLNSSQLLFNVQPASIHLQPASAYTHVTAGPAHPAHRPPVQPHQRLSCLPCWCPQLPPRLPAPSAASPTHATPQMPRHNRLICCAPALH